MKKTLRIIAAVLLVAMISVGALAEYEAIVLKPVTGYFLPDTGAEKLGELKKYAKVTVNMTQGKWALVTVGKTQGFINSYALCSVKPTGTATIKSDAKFLYITRKDDNPKWAKLVKGTMVYIHGTDGKGHTLVSDKNFKILGYVESSKLK